LQVSAAEGGGSGRTDYSEQHQEDEGDLQASAGQVSPGRDRYT